MKVLATEEESRNRESDTKKENTKKKGDSVDNLKGT